jgi:hypothetical protein
MNTIDRNPEPQPETPVQTESSSDLDNVSYDAKPMSGVTLAEQGSNVTVYPVDGGSTAFNMRAESHLNEKAWDLKSMLSRMNYVGSTSWSLTDAVQTQLYKADVIADLLQADIASAPFQRFIYWRCKHVMLHFQLTASRFYQGRAIVAFLPSQRVGTSITELYPVERLASVQHAFLDPANGTVVDFKIPFNYYKGYLDLTNGDTLGQIYIKVFNKLQAATLAATTVEIKTFMSIEGSEFKIPRSGGTSFRTLEARRDQGDWAVLETRAQSGFVANLGRDMGAEVDKIAESLIPVHMLTDILSSFGLDKPALGTNPIIQTHKDHQYMSPARTIEQLDKMLMDPAAQQLTDAEHFASDMDEMDIKFLVTKPTFLRTVNWSVTNTVGDILTSQIVDPTHPIIRHTPEYATAVYIPVLMSLISNDFTYWRGGIRFIFDVVASAFHEGRLDVTFHPTSMVPPLDYRTAMSQYAASYTIRNGKNCFEIVCPFLSDTPWKQVWHGETMATSTEDNTVRFTDYCVGVLALRVSVGLKAPNTVANNVDINIFMAAGEDFELNTQTMLGGDIQTTIPLHVRRPANHLALRTRAQAGDHGFTTDASYKKKTEAKAKSVMPVTLNAIPKDESSALPLAISRALTKDAKIPHFGERYLSLREICKRYQFIPRYVFTPPSAVDLTYPWVQPPLAFELFNTFGAISRYSSMYRNFRGMLNFKLEVHTLPVTGLFPVPHNGYVTILPGSVAPPNPGQLIQMTNFFGGAALTGTSGRSITVPLVRFSEKMIGEFQIPFLSIYPTNLLPADENITTFDSSIFYSTLLILSMDEYGQASLPANVQLSVAFSDEAHMGTFYGTPFVQGTPLLGGFAPYPNLTYL